MRDQVDRAQPTPQDKVAVVEEVERLLHLLPDELRQIVLWKLEGFTNAEISPMIGKTVRSVELKLQLTRRILEKEFAPGTRGRPLSPGGPAVDGSALPAGFLTGRRWGRARTVTQSLPGAAPGEVMEEDSGRDRDVQRARPRPHGDGDRQAAAIQPGPLDAPVLVAEDQGEPVGPGLALE